MILRPGVGFAKQDLFLRTVAKTHHVFRMEDMRQYINAIVNVTEAVAVLEKMLEEPKKQVEEYRKVDQGSDLMAAYSTTLSLIAENVAVLKRGMKNQRSRLNVVLSRIATDDKVCRGQHRGKRSPFNFVGSLLHGLFGVLDASSEEQLNALKDDVSKVVHLEQVQATIVTGLIGQVENITGQLAEGQRQLAADVQIVMTEFTVTAQIDRLQSMVALLSSNVDAIRGIVEDLAVVLQDASAGIVSPELLQDGLLESVVAELNAQSALRLDKVDLLHMGTTQVHRCGDTLVHQMTIEVPNRADWFVYEVIGTPFKTPRGFLSLDNLPRFLAYTYHHDSVIEFRAGQLRDVGCRRTTRAWFCPEIALTVIPRNASCAAMLAFNAIKTARNFPKICSFEFSDFHSPVFRQLANSPRILFSVYTNNFAALTCDGGYASRQYINGTGLLTLPNHCSLRVDDRVLLHSPIYSSFKVMPFKIDHVDARIYTNILQEMEADHHRPRTTSYKAHESDHRLKSLAAEQTALAKELNDYAALRRWVEVQRSRNTIWQGSLTVAVGLCSALGLWLFFCKNSCCPGCACLRGVPTSEPLVVPVRVAALKARGHDADRISAVANEHGGRPRPVRLRGALTSEPIAVSDQITAMESGGDDSSGVDTGEM